MASNSPTGSGTVKKLEDSAPVVDPQRHFRGTQNQDEIDDHRKHIFVGVHMPRPEKRHHHHRRKRSHNSKSHDKTNGLPNTDAEATNDTPLLEKVEQPSARVKFLLGDEADEEHESHDIFTEMEELYHHGDDEMQWKETARWIKYEEDVDVGADRWSKPHVSSLPLHSLFELRSCILNGAVCLDMEAETLEQIAGLVVDKLVATMQMEEDKREQVREALLRRHHHQSDKKHKDHNISKTGSFLPSIRSLSRAHMSSSAASEDSNNNGSDQKLGSDQTLEEKCSSSGNMPIYRSTSKIDSNPTLQRIASAASMKHKQHFMKKIPPGAEASNVLVGEVDFLQRPITAFVRLAQSVCLGDLTEVPIPTRFLFIMLGPHSEDDNSRYHEIGRCIATLMSDEIFHDVAYKAKNTEDLLSGIDEFLDQVTVLPPGVWDPNIRIEPPKITGNQREQRLSHVNSSQALLDGTDGGGGGGGNGHGEAENVHEGLTRTGRLFGGLVEDIKRRAPYYLSDYTNGLHIQCIASFVFMYFACITPAIAFAGLLGEATHDYMATIESLMSAAICGIGFSLFSGQPLIILESTGPILVYEKILVSFCDSTNPKLEYLPFRFWIGMWTAGLCIVLVATDASALVKYFTRFAEESFTSLIAAFFIFEAVHKLEGIYEKYPIQMHSPYNNSWYCECGPGVNDTGDIDWDNVKLEKCKNADIFLMSVILFVGTFIISYSLKESRTSRYLPTRLRQTVSDFAVLIALVIMISIDAIFGVPTPKLSVPSKFQPSNPNRQGWFIHPFGANPWWTAIAAVIPALLATILVFMDQQITAVIVNRKENKLKKGGGYHLDLTVLALLLALCSVLGLPWFVGATVLSINHVNSLKVEKAGAPGEIPRIVGCREQRVTGFMVALFMGIAMLMTPILQSIPMAVLYGVFLFMGISSLKGVQFVERLNLLFMPGKHQPDYHYLRTVGLKKVHLFTIIQLSCLVILWIVKSTKAALIFPIMVLAMVAVRKLMDFIFTQQELAELDDILPEIVKREKHDKKKKAEEEQAKAERLKAMPGRVQVPLSDGNLLSIPVANVEFLPGSADINISEEMAKTGIWKTMAANTGSYAEIIKRYNEGEKARDDNGSRKCKKRNKQRSEARAETDKNTNIIPEERNEPEAAKNETDQEFQQTTL